MASTQSRAEQVHRASSFPGLPDGSHPLSFHTVGHTAILDRGLLGMVCSIKCPGSVVIHTLDAARALRDAGIVVMGGFHSPMEREVLDILLRGSQPVVYCPARSLKGIRLGPPLRKAVEEDRLLLVSPFGEEARSTTAAQALVRNDLIVSLSRCLLVPHAQPGGKAWSAVQTAVSTGTPVLTLTGPDNFELVKAGAQAVAPEQLPEVAHEMLNTPSKPGFG